MKSSCRTLPILALSTTATFAALVNPAFAEVDTSARVVETLRAANQARADNASEAAAWRDEEARLRLLLEATQQERARLSASLASIRAELAEIESTASELGPERQRLAKLEALAAAQANRIESALDRLAQSTLPGVVPARAAPEPTAAGLASARARLERAERAARTVAVELVTGVLDGEPRRVELLRVGGAVGWWCSLDGEAAGLAHASGGQLALRPAPTSSDVASILSACRIAKGRAAPELVTLPVSAPVVVDEVSR